jgi:hypothetical protein
MMAAPLSLISGQCGDEFQGQHIAQSRVLVVGQEVMSYPWPLNSRASSASITWELNTSRWRPAFSSHLVS